MDPGVCLLELLGVLVSIGAWICSLATTVMSTWLTLSTELLPAESYELGLWETCVVQDHGTLECRPYDSLLGLPPDIKLARILMCATVATGLLGLILAIPGIYWVNVCDQGPEGLKSYASSTSPCRPSCRVGSSGMPCSAAGRRGFCTWWPAFCWSRPACVCEKSRAPRKGLYLYRDGTHACTQPLCHTRRCPWSMSDRCCWQQAACFRLSHLSVEGE
uniref:Claudin n=1 Tax=Esox lucius TaxID=8010 RepID=A0AAY5JYZ4_ESOLU